MSSVTWPSEVNSDFFDETKGFKEYAKTTEYLSGRTTAYMANSKMIRTRELSLSLTLSEYETFTDWYENDLHGVCGTFTCDTLGTGTYRFSEDFTEERSLPNIVIKMTIEEAL